MTIPYHEDLILRFFSCRGQLNFQQFCIAARGSIEETPLSNVISYSRLFFGLPRRHDWLSMVRPPGDADSYIVSSRVCDHPECIAKRVHRQ